MSTPVVLSAEAVELMESADHLATRTPLLAAVPQGLETSRLFPAITDGSLVRDDKEKIYQKVKFIAVIQDPDPTALEAFFPLNGEIIITSHRLVILSSDFRWFKEQTGVLHAAERLLLDVNQMVSDTLDTATTVVTAPIEAAVEKFLIGNDGNVSREDVAFRRSELSARFSSMAKNRDVERSYRVAGQIRYQWLSQITVHRAGKGILLPNRTSYLELSCASNASSPNMVRFFLDGFDPLDVGMFLLRAANRYAVVDDDGMVVRRALDPSQGEAKPTLEPNSRWGYRLPACPRPHGRLDVIS